MITGINPTYSGSSKKLTITAGTLSWPIVTFDAQYLVAYDDSWPDQATKPLIMYVDFGSVQSPVNKAFYYQWPSGIMLELALP